MQKKEKIMIFFDLKQMMNYTVDASLQKTEDGSIILIPKDGSKEYNSMKAVRGFKWFLDHLRIIILFLLILIALPYLWNWYKSFK